MSLIWLKLLFGFLFYIALDGNGARASSRYCYVKTYKRARYTVPYWWAARITKYRSVSTTQTLCCSGYGGNQCQPLCGGGSDPFTSCNRKEGRVIHKNGTVVTKSGGYCSAPMRCTGCNVGYYADSSGYCRACKQISNCNTPSCTSKDDTVCLWCVGELNKDKPGWNVYIGNSSRLQCQRACSWQYGYRCFPGTCTGEMVYDKDCHCADGFEGADCATANSRVLPNILEQDLILQDGVNIKLIVPEPKAKTEKVWTNRVQWSTATTATFSTTANYTLQQVQIPSYIKDSYMVPRIGINTIVTKIALYRTSTLSESTTTTNCNFTTHCYAKTTQNAQTSPWRSILNGGFPSPIEHLDTIRFTVTIQNGGVITYIDREQNISKSYYISGITNANTLELGFDLLEPQHCYEDSVRCNKDALFTPDFVQQTNFTLSWDGWADIDSGIKEYRFEVYRLQTIDPTADDLLLGPVPSIVLQKVVKYPENSTTLSLNEAGAYHVIIKTYDRVGNHKMARRIFLFDDASEVELQGVPTIAITADKDTGYKWINKQKSYIELVWPSRFINKRHTTNGWLNKVKEYGPEMLQCLEDVLGVSSRSIDKLHNIDGIVRIEIAYTVDFGGQSPTITNDFSTIPVNYFDAQKMIINEDFVDGKQLTFWIRGYDVMDKYAEDNVTVTIDLSPPVIQNLWLTKEDIVNISVHSVVELNQLTIEWDVYDVHSGLHEISWRLFDNFTKTDVVHGKSHETLQGGVQTEEQCEVKYIDYARGANCYCTPFDGCFHRHYQIKPRITATGEDGLLSGKEFGLHESDYFVEVTATNKALLTSVSYLKITIDTSPPHVGMVQDGKLGQFEVDFQQSLDLSAHWDGFFDKESGVWFYLYGFGNKCLDSSELDINSSKNQKVTKTYITASSYASYTAPGHGTYFVTVVAYNHALDHSSPVCSDGVTIDSGASVVSEVVVFGTVTRQGLIKDEQDNVWLLYRNRVIEEIADPSQECVDKATLVPSEDVSLYPHKRYMNGTRSRLRSSSVCFASDGVHHELSSFVTSDTELEISWNVSYSLSGIYDFEIGLSSQKHNVPDKMPFRSARQHQRIRIVYPIIMDGEEFFVIIKSMTKSAVTDYKVVGPFLVDTSKPVFEGEIKVTLQYADTNAYLVARWDSDAFGDHGDPNQLQFQVAVGSTKFGNDIMPLQNLENGASCVVTSHASCTAVNIDMLSWHLHGHHTYYMMIMATNTVGLFVTASSEGYLHDVMLASVGVVNDININSQVQFLDIDDIDYQTSSTHISTRWSGFKHPHLDIQFHVCLKDGQENVILICETADNDTTHTFQDIQLVPYKTYYQIVIAETDVGNVSATSDGVTVVIDGDTLHGIDVFDGVPCNGTSDEDLILERSHHHEAQHLKCTSDIDYQSATNELEAYWTIPADAKDHLQDVYWAVEERAPVDDYWKLFTQYQHIKTSLHLKNSQLFLKPGRSYRISVKYCAETYCFQPLVSDGVTIIPNPPTINEMHVHYNDTEHKINGEFLPFQDSDIEDPGEAREVMDHYEWAFTENDGDGRFLTKWERMSVVKTEAKTVKIAFEISLENEITFIKCWKLAVRGYTKAGLSAMVSTEIRNCSDINQVRPSVVIDAMGEQANASGDIHEGLPISMEENDIWPHDDMDYTPYHNILSAVWPTLRYEEYAWAILQIKEESPSIFYKQANTLQLRNLCTHPDAVKCGNTNVSYVNVLFDGEELLHGHRYIVCVHANATSLKLGFQTQELEEISSCSDGITVDLTPPIPGSVWIGNKTGQTYQTSVSDLTVNWNSFLDVEEDGYSVHTSGISAYQVALGTSMGRTNVMPFRDVGLTNHMVFHNLRLQSGHTYLAIVQAFDFTGQSSSGSSSAMRIDTTSPVLTEQRIQLKSRHITDTAFVSACWTDVFLDPESGIAYFSWSIGTHPGHDDAMTFTDTTEECDQTNPNDNITLNEGHAYFISVKAYNHASLYTTAISWAFTVDASPPVAGHVYDGPRIFDIKYHDVDYVSSTSTLEAHWEDFNDPHSTVKEYYVRVGSCPECDDVLVKQPIGLRNDLSLSMLRLVEGMRYYVTITACNTADLCASATSDGVVVEISPPIQGRVLDGIEGTDIQYQASRIQLGCKWYGFVDPQSGISHYVWRVGTTKGTGDILPATNVHISEEAFVLDLTAELNIMLPVGKRIYSTIRAYNYAGMFVESTSNGFIVDDTPPVVLEPLSLSPIGTFHSMASILRSVLRVRWNIEDKESYIETQYLSISSHVGGDFNSSLTKVEGIVRDYTFTGLNMHDGSIYDVKLICCNGAKLCSESNLTGLLIDSTPPLNGMFAINTDHAAALSRQPKWWMAWNSTNLNLAWLGFTDVHSGIVLYTINIGSSYLANDLNEKVNESTVVPHKYDGVEHDEGLVQLHTVRTQPLSKFKSVYISMWATNGVGLRSSIVHSEFTLIYGGKLALVRRCSSKTCHGHCTCAPDGELCNDGEGICNDVSSDNSNTIIDVNDYLDLTFPVNSTQVKHSPVNSCLAAKWTISKRQGLDPLWYEWSVGETMYDTPTNVFNETSERVWHDAGRNTSWVFTNENGKDLTERNKYSFFIRAWYNTNTFAIFKSPGVIIYSTPPEPVSTGGIKVFSIAKQQLFMQALRDVRTFAGMYVWGWLRGPADNSNTRNHGFNVKELIQGGTEDVDYITRTMNVKADWTNIFNIDGSLSKYHVYISTYQGGHDVHVLGQDIPSSTTSYNMTGLPLEEDTKYYTVVQAYNLAGLHYMVYSDGFMLDLHPPTTGIVHDGDAFKEMYATNSTTSLPSFWYGFSDKDSGIGTYEYCVSSFVGQCDIQPMSPVGMATKHDYISSTDFKSGSVLKTEVRAIDAVGHISDTVSSNGIMIDTSPPVRAKEVGYGLNIVQNPSFETESDSSDMNSRTLLTECDLDPPSHWMSSIGTCVYAVNLGALHNVPDGEICLMLRGSVTQVIHFSQNGRYRLQFSTSAVSLESLLLSASEGFVAVNGERYVFLLCEKPTGSSGKGFKNVWQTFVFFFDIFAHNVTLEFGTANSHTTIAIDDIQLERYIIHDRETVDIAGHVKVHTNFIHDWSSIHADWSFVDPESGIVEYLWAIGTVELGTQLQEFISVGRRTFAYTYSLHLVNETVLYVTVVAVNGAGMRTVSYSDPIIIDITPPLFLYVHDGLENGKDIDFFHKDSSSISGHWKVEDPESGVEECKWAIGTSPFDKSIKNFVTVESGQDYATAHFDSADLPDAVLYITVTCTNGAGLTNTGYSNGIRIIRSSPPMKGTLLEVLAASQTQYPVRGVYHGNSSEVRFRWAGFFRNDEDINSYMVALDGSDVHVEKLVVGTNEGFTYARFTNLQLPDGEYTVYVTSINEIQMYSQKTVATLQVLTRKPALTGTSIITSWNKSRGTLFAYWKDVFRSDHPMYFEVTVGMNEGGDGDIVQWQETTDAVSVIDLSIVDIPKDGLDVLLSIRAISYCGLFETAHSNIFISP